MGLKHPPPLFRSPRLPRIDRLQPNTAQLRYRGLYLEPIPYRYRITRRSPRQFSHTHTSRESLLRVNVEHPLFAHEYAQ